MYFTRTLSESVHLCSNKERNFYERLLYTVMNRFCSQLLVLLLR